MRKLQINTAQPYDVIIGSGLLSRLGELVDEVHKKCKVFIITDDNVAPLYLETTVAKLNSCGYKVYSYAFKNGEQNKNLQTFSQCLEQVALAKLSRTDIILALGGGIVGDVAGFVASAYMRGISYVQVPTTLLSAIDSSVGGKTAVNLQQGKNLVGAFFQPIRVVCDTLCLSTLSSQYYLDGLGEAVKYAILKGGKIYEILQSSNVEAQLPELIYECVKIKKEIVEQDEKEMSIRKLLNLGHTVGHAIEKLSSYSVTHGLAVAKGIAYIGKVSVKNGWLANEAYEKILALLTHLKLDYDCPYTKEQLMQYIVMDKKADGGNISIVVIRDIGKVEIVKVKLAELETIL